MAELTYLRPIVNAHSTYTTRYSVANGVASTT